MYAVLTPLNRIRSSLNVTLLYPEDESCSYDKEKAKFIS